MKTVTRYSKTVHNDEEARELEQYIAKKGGRIVGSLSNRAGGQTVAYEILTEGE